MPNLEWRNIKIGDVIKVDRPCEIRVVDITLDDDRKPQCKLALVDPLASLAQLPVKSTPTHQEG